MACKSGIKTESKAVENIKVICEHLDLDGMPEVPKTTNTQIGYSD